MIIYMLGMTLGGFLLGFYVVGELPLITETKLWFAVMVAVICGFSAWVLRFELRNWFYLWAITALGVYSFI